MVLFPKKILENPGIDPGTSHMLSERSTTWANSPVLIEYANWTTRPAA